MSVTVKKTKQKYVTRNPKTDCVFFPAQNTMVVANAEPCEQTTAIDTKNGQKVVDIAPYGIQIIKMED